MENRFWAVGVAVSQVVRENFCIERSSRGRPLGLQFFGQMKIDGFCFVSFFFGVSFHVFSVFCGLHNVLGVFFLRHYFRCFAA